MIRNDRQLKVAQEKRNAALEAAESLPTDDRIGYIDFARELQMEIDEYCGIRDGFVTSFELQSLDDFGEALVKARISRKLTQKALATELEVSEQMVQKDESGAYEKASLARLADILDVLGYEFRGKVVRKDDPNTERHFGGTVAVRTSTPSHAPWHNEGVTRWPMDDVFPVGQTLRMFFRSSPVEGMDSEPTAYEMIGPMHYESKGEGNPVMKLGRE